MDTPKLRLRRTKIGQYASHIFPVLVALTAGQGMLKATNVLALFATSGSTTPLSGAGLTETLTCSTATGLPPLRRLIWVKPGAAFASNASAVQCRGYPERTWSGTGPEATSQPLPSVAGTTLNILRHRLLLLRSLLPIPKPQDARDLGSVRPPRLLISSRASALPAPRPQRPIQTSG